MPNNRFDVAVIGGGHNGLVCACYLARAGLSVGILERRQRVGGAAVTEEFAPGFRNSAASYTVSLLRQRIVTELGLIERGLRFVRRPLANFIPSLSGPGLALYHESEATQASIAEHSPTDAERYPRFREELAQLAKFFDSFILEPPVDPSAGWREYPRLVKRLARLRHFRRADWAALWTALAGSAGDWLDRWFQHDALKGGLGFDSIVGHFSSPYASGSGYLLLHHALGDLQELGGAWGHAIGGMGAISAALARCALEHGVEIHCETPADSINPCRGGFEIGAGDTVYQATAVVGALHPVSFLTHLIDASLLPDDFVGRIRAHKNHSASFRVNVALSELPDFSCMPGTEAGAHHGSGIVIAPSLEYLDRAYRDADLTGMSHEPVVELVIPSTLDDTLAPAGTHVASLFCQHFKYALPEGRGWDEERDTALERVLDIVNRYAPNFRRSVIVASARSPLDLERDFGLLGGDIFHGVLSPDQLYWARPVWGFAQYRMPIRGIYLAASGAHPGGGVTGAPGFNAAQVVLEDYKARRIRPPSRV